MYLTDHNSVLDRSHKIDITLYCSINILDFKLIMHRKLWLILFKSLLQMYKDSSLDIFSYNKFVLFLKKKIFVY